MTIIRTFDGATLLMGCDPVTVTSGEVTSSELEEFFRKHTVDGNHAVAMKKHSLGQVSYFATIHGYPDNLSAKMLLHPTITTPRFLLSPANTSAKISDDLRRTV